MSISSEKRGHADKATRVEIITFHVAFLGGLLAALLRWAGVW